MKTAGELLANPTSAKPQQSGSISRETWAKVWLQLIAMGLQFEIVGSTTCEYWRQSLSDLSESDLNHGIRKCKEITGNLTLGQFRKLCFKPRLTPEHEKFAMLPNKLGNERFQELWGGVTKEMDKEGPDGPITRATNAGKLNKNFVRSKSADEIIDYCVRLYG